MSKSCANCSAEIPQGAPFCDNCGMPVSQAASPQEALQHKAAAQPPRTLPLAEESALDRRSWREQNKRSFLDKLRWSPWVPIPLLLLLLLVLLGGTTYALTRGTNEEVAVLDLVGASSVEEAQRMAGGNFEVVEGDGIESQGPIGTVVDQDPAPGEMAGKGSTIFVNVGDGANLPDVRGETREEAARILEGAGFEVEEETEESSEDNEGYVTEQDPQGGRRVTAEAGATVTITVGEGPANPTPEKTTSPAPKQAPPPPIEKKKVEEPKPKPTPPPAEKKKAEEPKPKPTPADKKAEEPKPTPVDEVEEPEPEPWPLPVDSVEEPEAAPPPPPPEPVPSPPPPEPEPSPPPPEPEPPPPQPQPQPQPPPQPQPQPQPPP